MLIQKENFLSILEESKKQTTKTRLGDIVLLTDERNEKNFVQYGLCRDKNGYHIISSWWDDRPYNKNDLPKYLEGEELKRAKKIFEALGWGS